MVISFKTARRVVPLGVILLSLAAATPVAARSSASGPRVGPGQHFGGRVNGSTGRQAPVVIRMACAGPIQPGQTGHPASGQTLELFLRGSSRADFGHTGPQTTSVGAFFNSLPPSATRASGSAVNFTRYGTKALPTAETLPCSGPGTVYFVPLPTVPGGRDAAVPVSFVGQP